MPKMHEGSIFTILEGNSNICIDQKHGTRRPFLGYKIITIFPCSLVSRICSEIVPYLNLQGFSPNSKGIYSDENCQFTVQSSGLWFR